MTGHWIATSPYETRGVQRHQTPLRNSGQVITSSEHSLQVKQLPWAARSSARLCGLEDLS